MATLDRRRFDYRQLPTVALVTYVIALAAWVAIIERWLPMPGAVGMSMARPMSAPGVPEAMALSNGLSGILLYLLMWGVMMVAMMYPSSVPLFSLYYRTIEGRSTPSKAGAVAAFMGTYAVIWALTGIVPLVVNAIVPIAVIAQHQTPLVLGGTLVLLSGYQLSPYKNRCLRYCRSPIGFLMTHLEPGIRGAARISVRFSVFCFGCCWALFALMVVVGSMNLLWMAIITVALSLERVVSWGDRLATGIGVIAGVSGVGLLVIAML